MNFFKSLNLSKRQKFVIATGVLLAGIIFSRVGIGELLFWRVRVVIFALAAVAGTILALRDEDFSGVEWITLPILPSMFAISALLVYPLIPQQADFLLGASASPDTSLLLGLLIRMGFLLLFMTGYYAALLTANIFNVAAVKGIQLLRVAHSIGFLVTVATALLFYIVIISFHQSALINFAAVFIVTLPLALESVWNINLEAGIGKSVRIFSLLIAFIVAQVAFALSFWPVAISIFAIFLTAIFYELLGIVQYHVSGRLNSRVANEFVVVAIVVFLLTVITTIWGA